MNKESLYDLLKNSVQEIEFIKADGSMRVMKCTLRDDLVGTRSFSSNTGPAHLLSVWDLEKDAWRSFKIDSLVSLKQV